mmetsp:Transcript_23684/g.65749  ORF Transcript_23684/g.65749 Transcript_23684/m.65749 type:complete len:499 (+) Transcript_23684:73-1569(+)
MRWVKPIAQIASGDTFVSSLCKKMTAKALVGDGGFVALDDDGEPTYDNYDILGQSPPSLSTELIDRLRLFSPRTWWGMIVLEDRSYFSPFDLSTIVRSFVGLFLPLLMLWTISFVHITILRHEHSGETTTSAGGVPKMMLGRLIFVSMVSPWSLQCIYQICRELSIVLKSLRRTLKNRSETLTRAIDVLLERIRNHRAYRTRRFDVYLPPSLGNSIPSGRGNDHSNKLEALLLIPGASVSHVAYSEVAARLSDNGFLVAVLSIEPLRLAHHHLGADKTSVKRIMEQITEEIYSHAAATNSWWYADHCSDIVGETAPVIAIEWTLMGHSMGSFASMKLFDEFFDAENGNYDNMTRKCFSSKPPESFVSKQRQLFSERPRLDVFIAYKLVMWGVAAFAEVATDLSHHTRAKILIVQGTKDKLVDMMRYRQAELDANFPPGTETEEIIGGTHEGFSSYNPPNTFDDEDETDSMGKKIRTKSLSLEEQHKRACDATVRFLRS